MAGYTKPQRLGEMFGWGDNPFYKSFDANRNAVVQGFANIGSNPLNPGAGFSQGFAQGSLMDQQRAAEAEQQQEQDNQTNATRSWLEQQGYTDLVPLIDAGQADVAFNEALKRRQPQAAPSPIKVGAGETLLDPTTSQPLYQGQPDVQDQFGNEKDLYSQYSASDPVKMYETVKGGYERVRQSAALSTGAGDMGLIYGYMKMLDPGSVVRESEFAMAAQAGSYGEQIQGMVQRVINGERLPESVRQQFVQAADQIYSETAANLGDINSQFTERAQQYNINPSLFIRQPEQYPQLNQAGNFTTSSGVNWGF